MYQDIAFELTPAKARKLRQISKICKIEIPDLSIANKNLVSNALAQFIVDHGFRCGIIANDEEDLEPEYVLKSIAASTDKEILILPNLSFGKSVLSKKADWKTIIETNKINAKVITFKNLLDLKFQNSNRDKIIFIERDSDRSIDNLSILCLEFQQVIVFVKKEHARYIIRNQQFLFINEQKFVLQNESQDGVFNKNIISEYPWWEIGCVLNMQMPRYIFNNNQYKKLLNNFKTKDINDLAIMYSIYLHDRMKNYI